MGILDYGVWRHLAIGFKLYPSITVQIEILEIYLLQELHSPCT
jgi:hypothetical protein